MKYNKNKKDHLPATAVSPEDWLSNHEDYLFNFAKARINDDELVRDLVQETFLAALESLTTFQHNSSERTWLTGILKKKIYKSYENKSRNIIHLIENYNPRQNINDGNGLRTIQMASLSSIDNLFYSKEFTIVLQNCLKQLPKLSQSVFLMKYFTDEPKENICARLRISESYYWVICHRIKAHFKKYLQQYWY